MRNLLLIILSFTFFCPSLAQVNCDDLISYRLKIESTWNSRKTDFEIKKDAVNTYKTYKKELLSEMNYATSDFQMIPMTLKLTADWLNGILSATHPKGVLLKVSENSIKEILQEGSISKLDNTSNKLINQELIERLLLFVKQVEPISKTIADLIENVKNFEDHRQLQIEVKGIVDKIDSLIYSHNESLQISGQAFEEVNNYMSYINNYLTDNCGYNSKYIIEKHLESVYGQENYSRAKDELYLEIRNPTNSNFSQNLPEVYGNMSSGNYDVVLNEVKTKFPGAFGSYKKYLDDNVSSGIDLSNRILEKSVQNVNYQINAGLDLTIKDISKFSEKVAIEFQGSLSNISKDTQIEDKLFELVTDHYIIENATKHSAEISSRYLEIINYNYHGDLDRINDLSAEQLASELAELGYSLGERMLEEKLIARYVIPEFGKLLDMEISKEQATSAYKLLTGNLESITEPISEKFEAFQTKLMDESIETLDLIQKFENDISFSDGDLGFLKMTILENFKNPEALEKQLNSLKNIPSFKTKFGKDEVEKLIAESERIKDKIETLNTINTISQYAAVTKSFLQTFDLGSPEVYEATDIAIAGLTIYGGIVSGRYDVAITSAMGMFSKPQQSAESKMLKEVLKRLEVIDEKLNKINRKLVRIEYKMDSLHYVEMKKLNELSIKIDSLFDGVNNKLDEILGQDLNHCMTCLDLDFNYKLESYDEIINHYQSNSWSIGPCLLGLNNLLIEKWDNLNSTFPSQLKISKKRLVTDLYKPSLDYYNVRFKNDPSAFYNLLQNDNIANNDFESYMDWKSILDRNTEFDINKLHQNVTTEYLNPILVSQLAETYLKYDVYLNFGEYQKGVRSFQDILDNPPKLDVINKKRLQILLQYIDISLAQQAILSGYHTLRFLRSTFKDGTSNDHLKLAFDAVRNNEFLKQNLAIYHVSTYLENDNTTSNYLQFLDRSKQMDATFDVGTWFKLYSKKDVDGVYKLKFVVKSQNALDEIQFDFDFPENALSSKLVVRPELLTLKKLRDIAYERLVEYEFSSLSKTSTGILHKLSVR
ncbi:MAG: hypothetical protein NXI20_24990 [bacterium]|nr:hypothetical protein [bacterium]